MRRARPHRIQRKKHRIKISKSHRHTNTNHHSGSKRISTTMIQVRWGDHLNITHNRVQIATIEEWQSSRSRTEHQSLTTTSIKEEQHQDRLSTAIKETSDLWQGLVSKKLSSKSLYLRLISLKTFIRRSHKQQNSRVPVDLAQSPGMLTHHSLRLLRDRNSIRKSMLLRLAWIRIRIRIWQLQCMVRISPSHGNRKICREMCNLRTVKMIFCDRWVAIIRKSMKKYKDHSSKNKEARWKTINPNTGTVKSI